MAAVKGLTEPLLKAQPSSIGNANLERVAFVLGHAWPAQYHEYTCEKHGTAATVLCWYPLGQVGYLLQYFAGIK